jgi:4-aminobutyrate aminotransferase
LVTIQLLEERLVSNAATIGDYVMGRLKEMQRRHRLIGDVRGKGLLIGIECVRDPETKERAVTERNRIMQRCFEKGLLLLGCGQNVIRLVPPLMITRQEADVALEILDAVFAEVARR